MLPISRTMHILGRCIPPNISELNLTYRKALHSDTEYILWLRKETMNEHLANAGFDLNEENHLKGIEYQFENAKIILHNNRKIGLLKKSESEEYIKLIQIQISPEYQGQGIGKQVIKSIIYDAFKKDKAVHLSVLKDNPAKRLYLNLGFEIIDENSHSLIMRTKKAHNHG